MPTDPLLHPANITGSPASSAAGVAAMAPVVIGALSSFHVPTSAAEWITLAFGVLALFLRG